MTFTLIGLNRQAFVSDFDALLRTGVIAVATSFLLAYMLEAGAKALRVKHETAVGAMLMGTLKNWSMAGGLLLNLFSERSIIPPSLSNTCTIVQLMLLCTWSWEQNRYELATFT